MNLILKKLFKKNYPFQFVQDGEEIKIKLSKEKKLKKK